MDNYKEMFVGGALPSIYRAIVVDNNDPDKRGRVQIRLPMLHGIPGSGSYIMDKNLPWAYPVITQGTSSDAGLWVIPVIGSVVWVMFLEGMNNEPVYLGTSPTLINKKAIDGKAPGSSGLVPDLYDEQGLLYRLLYRSADKSEISFDRDGNVFIGFRDDDNNKKTGLVIESDHIYLIENGVIKQ